MITKILTLALVLLQTFGAFAQRDPSKEILVFFKEGVTRQSQVLNGQSGFKASVKSAELVSALSNVGIRESMLEAANPKFNESDTLRILPDGTALRQLNMTRLFRIKVPEGRSKKELLGALNQLPEVLYAESNGTVSHQAIPSDAFYFDQWGLNNDLTSGADIHAEAAWDIYTGNPDNIIAIIDGGTDVSHVDLSGKISGGDVGWGWDGHGIHVSGIAAAESNNAQGISGVDWQAQIHPQRIDGLTDDVDTYNAIVDAVNYSANMHVLNNSWSLENEDGSPGRNSITVRQAFAYAFKANRTSVVAMGNHQDTYPNVVTYPAGFANVIAVGASNFFDRIAFFSAQGNHIDVAAPGVDILSTFTGGGYSFLSGTSMATAYVSGGASLLKGFRSDLANTDIENLIRLSADDLDNSASINDGTTSGFDNASGTGRVNMERALNYLQPPYTLSHWTASSGSTYSSTGNILYQFLGAGSLASGNYIAKRYEVRKTVTFPQPFCHLVGAWGRGAGNGWSAANPNYGEGFCEIVQGTLTNTGATLRTYVYQVMNTIGQTIGWYPTTVANATFSHTVLGIVNPNTAIIGDDLVCTNGQYSLLTIPAGTSIVWSSNDPGSLQINSATGAATRQNNNNTAVNVIATYAGGDCNGASMTKPVWVGAPNYFNPSGVSEECSSIPIRFDAYVYDPSLVTDYRWYLDGSLYVEGGDELTTIYVSTSAGDHEIGLQVGNACDWADHIETMNFLIYSCLYANYTAYPNPALNELTIAAILPVTSSTDISIGTFTVRLFDKVSNKVREAKSQDSKVSLNISDLPNGLYYLQVSDHHETSTRQIVINH